MKIVFISPCYNASKNLSQLIASLNKQTDDRWECIFIDDISSDDTWKKLNELTSGDNRFKIIKNKEKKFALKNIVTEARTYENSDEVIIATIDGDDSLCNPDSVKLIIDQYEIGSDVVWTAHKWDINNLNISKDMPKNVNPYQWPWCTSHLRTFRSSLLSQISDKNFKNTKGEWFQRGYDQALMLPLLSLTNKRKYIDTVCYLYNIDSVSVDDRDWAEMKQISTINLVRSRGFLK
ncbi:glycosyltransferase [bacterium]|nr:glycosyltransferase [bacterium]